MLCNNMKCHHIFSATVAIVLVAFHCCEAQIGKTEFPFEFFAFENFDVTRKVFTDELKLVKVAANIRSTLELRREKIEVRYSRGLG